MEKPVLGLHLLCLASIRHASTMHKVAHGFCGVVRHPKSVHSPTHFYDATEKLSHWLKGCAKMIESPYPHHPLCNCNTVLQHCLYYSRTFHQELAQLIWKGQCCTCNDNIHPSRHKLALFCGALTMPPRQRSRNFFWCSVFSLSRRGLTEATETVNLLINW